MQSPFTQASPPEHGLSHAPQWSALLLKSTQLEPQGVSPAGQALWHTPSEQICPAGQALPQTPQLAPSDWRSVQ